MLSCVATQPASARRTHRDMHHDRPSTSPPATAHPQTATRLPWLDRKAEPAARIDRRSTLSRVLYPTVAQSLDPVKAPLGASFFDAGNGPIDCFCRIPYVVPGNWYPQAKANDDAPDIWWLSGSPDCPRGFICLPRRPRLLYRTLQLDAHLWVATKMLCSEKLQVTEVTTDNP